ncbi:hypothetical protein JAAARDRAFT_518728 [Jaapia argillacea MUCL 33604]|uniref:Protein kinase domain-containing protein n=1 Tax=Jaapia argillacea MUCL 33604 TaxID=933084 RepID=A0A067QGD7_9AGAM|nr:hypothetical protein JAAARDRAFT_518728 [Jaapia argillacea MUCL 33604]
MVSYQWWCPHERLPRSLQREASRPQAASRPIPGFLLLIASILLRSYVVQLFLRESLLRSQLDSPSILPFLGIHVPPLGLPVIVTPWLQKGTIIQFLTSVDSPGSHRRRLLFEVAEGVAYLHENGFIHGEILGENVLIDDDMHAQLAGFNSLDVESTKTFGKAEETLIVQVREEIKWTGSLRWMAPEKLFGDAPTRTYETDVFGFGRLCLEVFTMKIPYFDQSDASMLLKVMGGELPLRPSTHDGQGTLIPDEWWTLMLRCWETDPSARPTMEDIVSTLKGGLFEVELSR